MGSYMKSLFLDFAGTPRLLQILYWPPSCGSDVMSTWHLRRKKDVPSLSDCRASTDTFSLWWCSCDFLPGYKYLLKTCVASRLQAVRWLGQVCWGQLILQLLKALWGAQQGSRMVWRENSLRSQLKADVSKMQCKWVLEGIFSQNALDFTFVLCPLFLSASPWLPPFFPLVFTSTEFQSPH